MWIKFKSRDQTRDLEGRRMGIAAKFIGFDMVIICYKEFEKFALCKSVSQSETIFILYFEPVESGHVKINSS